MRLPGRIAAAIEVLDDIAARHRPVADALKDWGLSHRFAGSGDRAAIGNMVHDALRKRRSHAFVMDSDASRALALAVVVRDWSLNAEELTAAFAGDPHAPAPPTEQELVRLVAADPLAGAPDAVRADVPDWLAPHLAQSLGADWVAEAVGMAARAPVDLRVNGLRADRARVLKSLSRFSPKPTALSPIGVRVAPGVRDERAPAVQTDEGFLKGWFEVQDEGSQLAALLSGAAAGQQVLDYCAGAGGKTLALAAMMQNRGQIFAHDSDRSRLAPIYDRLKRATARNVQVRPPAGPDALSDLAGRMDLVLVDAPCTGTGTWRRRPDAKWRLSEAQLQVRQAERMAILDDAARFVRPGGALVYITCSVLDAENGGQIEAFLARDPGFAIGDLADAWRALTGADAPLATRHGLQLTPRRTGTDGFFVSMLTRKM